jgi:2-methylcitrate dehydratase PrpD
MTTMTGPRAGQTREVAEFVSAFPAERIPDLALERARQAIADLIGVALAGRRHVTGQTMLDYVTDQGARPVAGIIGGGRSTPELASLANGAMAHALEFDDTHHPLYGHPSCSIVPAVLAVGEEVGGTFGTALEAYVIGVEIDAALGAHMMMLHSEKGFHSTGTIGTLGAAAAAARMAGLSVEATQHAIGIAASRAAGLRVNVGTMTKPLHAGAAAMSAVQAVRLAARGWDAHPDTLTGPIGFCAAFLGGPRDEVDITTDLGVHWSLLQPYGYAIKPYPSCGATHTAIDAVLALRADLGTEPVDRIRVGVSKRAPHLLIYDRPRTGAEGRFSGHYTVAAALARGSISLTDFTDQAVGDTAVRALMERIEIVVDDQHADSTQYPATVQVWTRSGRVLEETVLLARGKNANPLTEDALCAKFADCTGSGGADLWHTLRHAQRRQPVADLVLATQQLTTPEG